MRKLSIAALALAAVLAVAGVALAANTYSVDKAVVKAKSVGSQKKPVAAQYNFEFSVGETNGNRPSVIRQYRIGTEGLKAFAKSRPACTFAQATNPDVGSASQLAPACRKAFVGKGSIHNEAGAPNDPTQKITCDVVLTLINIKDGDPRYPATQKQIKKTGGVAIRIDQPQDQGVDDPTKCPPIDLHEALAAPWYPAKIGGILSSELRFTVPDTLAHPGGLDNAVKTTASVIQKKTGRAKVGRKTRTVGYMSSVGRKGKTRTTRVTYVDETGAKQTATREGK